MAARRRLNLLCSGTLDGAEVNVRIAAMIEDDRGLWLIREKPVMGIIGSGVVALDAFLDAIGGLPIAGDVAVDDAFQQIFALIGEVDGAKQLN